MHRSLVDSSCLRSVGYDADEESLELEFTSGAIYRYRNVPPHIYHELMTADSHGSYFTSHIRPVYADYLEVRPPLESSA